LYYFIIAALQPCT